MNETPNRLTVVIWTVSLGILTSFTAGSMISVADAGDDLLLTVVAFVLSSAVLYPVVVRNWERWAREQPLVRIVVYFAPLFFVMVLLSGLVHLLFGRWGVVTTLLETAVAVVTFALTIWLSFYGGADLVRKYVVRKLDVEW
ncbi:hypothetical protein [Halorhabdus amylolytica]|uniref:hypothetical protein n=1 Tax=Halorhabdus amylolytica TaxID=2559573 RepID=UPI0010AA6CAC|nr:hypothetical protein [Halorhabdus amylolytica]